eukprot:943519-Amphidinium_carterae.1
MVGTPECHRRIAWSFETSWLSLLQLGRDFARGGITAAAEWRVQGNCSIDSMWSPQEVASTETPGGFHPCIARLSSRPWMLGAAWACITGTRMASRMVGAAWCSAGGKAS